MEKTAYVGRFEKNGDESEKKSRFIYNFGAIAHEVKRYAITNVNS